MVYTTSMITRLAQFGRFAPPVENQYTSDAASNPFGIVELIVSNMIGLLTVIAGLYFVVNMILAGMKWLGSGGESGKVADARMQIIQSVLGIIVIVAAYSIIGIIGTIVGFDILNPAQLLNQLTP